MGRKGVSIRKPRKSKSPSNNTGGYSNTHTGENSPVHSLVKDRSTPLNRGGMHPPVETNKKPNK
jgi:hypothetical protein